MNISREAMHDVIQNWQVRIRSENNAPYDFLPKLDWNKLSLIDLAMYGRFVLSRHFLSSAQNQY